MKIEISIATIEDVSDILYLQHKTFHDDGYGGPAIETMEECLKAFKEDDIYKVVYENKIIGSVRIQKLKSREYRIKRLFIAEEYQELHIGSKLLKEVEELYDWNVLSLDTPAFNKKNRAFYKKAGYQEVGTTDYHGLLLIELEKKEEFI